MRIADIVVGQRHRKDMGDLHGLARSIAEIGLLHPVVVNADGCLIAGERRLEACKLLGWVDVPATVVNLTNIVRGETDENVCRKDFTLSEAAAIADALEPVEREAARERQGYEAFTSEKFTELPRGRALDKVATVVGLSRPTLAKAREIIKAAEHEPERFGKLVEQMDRTGNVHGAYRMFKRAQDEQQVLSVQPMQGKYRTILIDPPWDYEGLSLAGRAMPEYAVMDQEQLLALPVAEWAEDTCHLYLWTTNNFMPRAVALVAAWGFEYKTLITWVKPRIGLGSYFRNSTEHCLFGVRGNLTTRVKDIPTHFLADVGAHSEKPEEIYRICERASYPPYLEAFSRRNRDGWAVWGAGVVSQSLS